MTKDVGRWSRAGWHDLKCWRAWAADPMTTECICRGAKQPNGVGPTPAREGLDVDPDRLLRAIERVRPFADFTRGTVNDVLAVYAALAGDET